MKSKKSNTAESKSKTMTVDEREAYWRQMVDEHQRSGLSQTQFAKQRGVAASSLSEWRYRLKKSKNKSLKSILNPVVVSDKTKVANALITPVTPTDQQADGALRHTLELKHVSGFSMVVDAQVEEATLRRALKCLAELTRGG